jgi:hypothetical protein
MDYQAPGGSLLASLEIHSGLAKAWQRKTKTFSISAWDSYPGRIMSRRRAKPLKLLDLTSPLGGKKPVLASLNCWI